jgi:hypothetical protein
VRRVWSSEGANERASERRREGGREGETVVPFSLAADAGPISHH